MAISSFATISRSFSFHHCLTMRSPQEFHKYECFLYDCIDPIHLFYDTLDPKNAEVFSVKNKTQHILTIITKITKSLLEEVPNLKIVAVAGAGYNHIDVRLVHSYGAKVSNAPHVLDEAVADTTIALLLAAARNLHQGVTFAMSVETKFFSKNQLSSQISGTTVGIVGMGGIGFEVAKRLQGFNMKVLYHNRNQRSSNDEAMVKAAFCPNLDEMLPLCDYVIISVKLTPQTHKLFGADQFRLMKSTAILVNVSRGATVDQNALVEALTSGQIHFAALDVTEPEPLPRDHPLLKLSNVIITPHIGSATKKARLAMLQKAVDNVLAAVQGKELPSEAL